MLPNRRGPRELVLVPSPLCPLLCYPDLLAVRIRPQTINGGLCFSERPLVTENSYSRGVYPYPTLCTAQTREDFCSQIEEEEKERKEAP